MQYPINREIKIGLDAKGHAVTIEIEIEHKAQETDTTGAPIIKRSTTLQPITDYKTLSICGRSRGSGGQMQDTIREELDSYTKLFLPKASIIRLLDIWDAYHLNDTNPACIHQTALGWDSGKKIELHTYSIDWDVRRSLERQYEKDTGIRKDAVKPAFRYRATSHAGELLYRLSDAGIKPFAFVTVAPLKLARVLQEFEPIAPHKLKEYNERARIAQAEGNILLPRTKPPILHTVETKTVNWVRPEDHPEGVLGKACPECGYKYGSAWLVGALPVEIEQEILTLCDSAPIESRTATSQDDETAAKLAEWGVKFRATKIPQGKCPRWCKDDKHTHGDQYRVTFWRGMGKRFAIDFWNSAHNKEQGQEPTANDVLGCLQFSDPGSFKNFCGEFGYSEDSREGERIYKAVKKEARKVSGFFTDQEVKQLQEMF